MEKKDVIIEAQNAQAPSPKDVKEEPVMTESQLKRMQQSALLDAFFRIHDFLVAHSFMPIRRLLMDEINWDDRLIAIKGGRGVGKTDFLLRRSQDICALFYTMFLYG
jgi:hypothetical protein